GGDCDSAPCHSKMGLSDANQHRALVRAHSQLAADDIRSRPTCQTRGVVGGSHVGRDPVSVTRGCDDRPGLGSGPRAYHQARDKAGGPLTVQPGDRHRQLAAPMGTVRRGQPSDIKVAMDWTDFEADGQATIMLSLLTRHGRATPLVWLTVDTATLKNRRNGYEHQVLVRLAEVLPAAVNAVGYPVKTVVCVQAKDMKEPWCLAASTTEEPARALINLYAKRWGIECAFRDTKDLRFGMGMSSVHVSTPDRRDRLWLISALAVVLLTLLGTAGEALGYDRHLKSNTTKRRTHSLFRQGAMLYELIPNMPEHLLRPLVERFAEMLVEQPVFAETFGAI